MNYQNIDYNSLKKCRKQRFKSVKNSSICRPTTHHSTNENQPRPYPHPRGSINSTKDTSMDTHATTQPHHTQPAMPTGETRTRTKRVTKTHRQRAYAAQAARTSAIIIIINKKCNSTNSFTKSEHTLQIHRGKYREIIAF